MTNITMIVLSECLNDVRVYREALALEKQGYKIKIISLSSNKKKIREHISKNIEVLRLFNSRFKNKNSPIGYLLSYLFFTFQLFDILLFNKEFCDTDIFHVHNPPDLLVIPVLLFNFFFKKKIILDRHEPFALSVVSHLRLSEESIIYLFLNALEKLIAKTVNGVIVINEIEEDDYKKAKIRNIVKVGNNTFDSENYKTSKEETSILIDRSKLNLSDSDIVLLYQGLIGKLRDLNTAIDLIKESPDPRYRLILVGDGPYRYQIQSRIENLGLSDKIRFVGFIPPQNVKEYIKIADVCLVLASNVPIYRHATPNKLYEYLAYEKRTVVPFLENIVYLTQSNLPYYEPGSKISLMKAINKALKMSDKEVSIKAQRILNRNSGEKDENNLLFLYKSIEYKN